MVVYMFGGSIDSQSVKFGFGSMESEFAVIRHEKRKAPTRMD